MIAQLIPADSALPIRTITFSKAGKPSLEELQAAVGGYIERVPINGGHLYCNEEGKLKGMPVNERASRIAHAYALPESDIVVGDTLAWTRNGVEV